MRTFVSLSKEWRCGEEYPCKPLKIYEARIKNKLSYLKSRKNWHVSSLPNSDWPTILSGVMGRPLIRAKPFCLLSLHMELCCTTFLENFFSKAYFFFINLLSFLKKRFHCFLEGIFFFLYGASSQRIMIRCKSVKLLQRAILNKEVGNWCVILKTFVQS